MNQTDDLERRISKLEDESEIRRVFYNYCFRQDQRNVEAFLSLLTDDVRLAFPGWDLEVNGKENLKKYFIEQVFATHEYHMHKVTNFNVQIDGEKAYGEAYLSLHSSYQGEPQEAYIRYMLQFRKEKGMWLLNEINCEVILWNGSLSPQDQSVYERFTVS
ncbi:MAG: nuclear transport factor 2 family protein [Methanomassiliicoccales archaeon]|nr:MAG: nuclear transport factor 2 family protein [Methanomassiliicoccales archaeon]